MRKDNLTHGAENRNKGGHNMVSETEEIRTTREETVTPEVCPFCGSPLDSGQLGNLGPVTELLAEGHWLKKQGVLTEAMHVAVKIVKTMNENPMWFKELLDESSEDNLEKIGKLIRDDLIMHEIRPIQQTLSELKGSPLRLGKIEEIRAAKRLKAVSPEDSFTTEKSTKSGEDVTCEVRENKKTVGKIVVESKKVKSWNKSYLEQIKNYMKRENTEFGIIVTTTMPDDSLSYATWTNGVLVVKMEHLEPAYIFMRKYLIMCRKLEAEYTAKIERLEVKEQAMHKLRKIVSDGKLDEIIEGIDGQITKIEDTTNKAENYIVNTLFAGIRKNTGKIRELATKLVNEYIEKIRLQLKGNLAKPK
jgi:hypothetical protein